MSRPSQIIIGSVAGFLGILVFFLTLFQRPNPAINNQNALLLLSGFAICISIACFVQKSRPLTMRLIGLGLCAGGIATYFFVPEAPNAPDRSTARSYAFLILMTAGGGWLAITGRYPTWGAYGQAFAMIEAENKKEKEEYAEDDDQS